MISLCLGYSVIGLFVGLEMKKTAIFFISWCSDMLPVQVIWLLGYSLSHLPDEPSVPWLFSYWVIYWFRYEQICNFIVGIRSQ